MLLTGPITRERFGNINLNDPFFDSLKADYSEFSDWFAQKQSKEAWVLREGGKLLAFLYLKGETEALDDVEPPRPPLSRLKAGTMKVDAHGTRLGERFLRLMFDEALDRRAAEIYVTVFPKHKGLTKLLSRWGFTKQGTKTTANGIEDVYFRAMRWTGRGVYKDYPFMNTAGRRKYLLGIYPEFHTRLFPDSKLRTESSEVIRNVSHTNSIFKVYIGWSRAISKLRPGDIVIIYRTKDDKATSGWYSSVATSVCVIDKVKPGPEFTSEQEFVQRCSSYSVFTEDELRGYWRKQRDNLTAVRMTYNFAFLKRPNRKTLIEDAGLDGNERWNVLSLTDQQFRAILSLGQADERLIIDQA
ncbi:MAG: N-acetyltransferase [Myxococcota bacterium]